MAKHKSLEPALSYEKTINLFIGDDKGQKCTVADCPADAFSVLMQVAATTASNPEAAVKSLAGLDYHYLIDRWYAIMTLSEHGAAIPLFGASDSGDSHARKTGRAQDTEAMRGSRSRQSGIQGIDPSEQYVLNLPLGRF